MKSIWVKKESTVRSQAVLPQNVRVKRSAMINPTQTWRPKGAYLDSVNKGNGSYTARQFIWQSEEDLKDYAIMTVLPLERKNHGIGTIKTSIHRPFEKSECGELKFNLRSVSKSVDKEA
ncbi:hypothetical protein Tco_0528824 [Tanacetum coccineum]